MAFKDTKIAAFVKRRKKILFGAGGLYVLLGPKTGMMLPVYFLAAGAVLKNLPSPEYKIVMNYFSRDITIESMKEKKDGCIRIKASHYNNKLKERTRTYYLQPGELAYEIPPKSIDSIVSKLEVGDQVTAYGFTDRKVVKYINELEPKK